jgi:hypothetical protein
MQRYPFEIVDVVEPGKDVEGVAEAKGRPTAGVFHVANSWSQIILTTIRSGKGLALPISLEWCRFGTGGYGSEGQANCLPYALADAFKWLSGEHGPDDGGVDSGGIPGPRR